MTTEKRYPRVPLRERAFYAFCRAITVGLSRVYFPGLVFHRDRLPRSGPYVVAPVHRSYVDWLIVARISKRRLRYIVKGEVWKSRATGKLLEMLGAFPVRRGAADREAVHRAIEALDTGEPLVMFPEGTRRSGAVVDDLREGAVYVALRANVPIVPIGIAGSEGSMPRGSKFPRPKWTKVVIGSPLFLDGTATDGRRVTRSAIHAGTEQLKAALQQVFDEAQSLTKHNRTD